MFLSRCVELFLRIYAPPKQVRRLLGVIVPEGSSEYNVELVQTVNVGDTLVGSFSVRFFHHFFHLGFEAPTASRRISTPPTQPYRSDRGGLDTVAPTSKLHRAVSRRISIGFGRAW